MHWLQFDNAAEAINAATNGAGKQLSTLGVLVSGTGGMSFPIGKTAKFLALGPGESTKFFVQAMLHKLGTSAA